MKNIAIKSPYITLGQLLKFTDLVSSGGEAKEFLATHKILCNDHPDSRRGRKLFPGDIIKMDTGTVIRIVKNDEN